ncbi:MAG: 5'-methylthioadenosine/adenosylhomocysteine nucleosidase, partial [Clostridia bacterium]|nr:5'-methylthioadenosine/adenosylhomocysteine nucleosidase [Clostridia bacterium]
GEMEGASIGHVAYVNGVPFAILRVISDNASGESNMDYPQFCEIAAQKSIKICTEFVKKSV